MRGYKYRILPTKEQSQLIDLTISHCRYVWNGFLALKEFRYKEFGEKLNYADMSKLLTEIKKTDVFLNDVDAIALQQTLRQLDDAYKRFFNGLCKYPKFKSKKNSKSSYKTLNIKLNNNNIKLPKIGWVKYVNSRDISGRIMSATISKTPTNKYYISLTVDESVEKLKPTDKEVGIDLGLKTFAMCSDGFEIKAPKPLWKYSTRLKKLQRKLSNKPKKYTKNYEKLRLKIALLHEKITNIRKDFQHKLSTKLIRENQLICLETLNIKGMTKNHKLSKAILDCGFYSFVEMLKYKASMYGRQIQFIDMFYPSSKTCSCCGNVKEKLLLSERTYICDKCGAVIDRDYNASINILVEGKRLIRG